MIPITIQNNGTLTVDDYGRSHYDIDSLPEKYRDAFFKLYACDAPTTIPSLGCRLSNAVWIFENETDNEIFGMPSGPVDPHF